LNFWEYLLCYGDDGTGFLFGNRGKLFLSYGGVGVQKDGVNRCLCRQRIACSFGNV
jgi:hypothetical protein